MTQRPTPTLRRSLASHFALASLIPVLLVALVVLYHLAGHTYRDVADKNHLLARAASAQVEVFLREPRRTLEHVRDILEGGAPLGAEDTRLLLDDHVQHSDLFESIYVLDRRGRVAYVGLPSELRGLREDFLGIDLSHKAFYREARETDAPIWSDTFLSLISGKMSLALCVPAGERLLVGNFNLALLASLTRGIQAQDRVLVSIVDRSGAIVVHPDPAVGARQVNVRDLPPVRRGLQGEEGTYPYEFAGVPYLGSVSRIPGPGWLALVSQREADAYRSLREAGWIFALGALGALLLALGFGFSRARRLSRPVADLAAQARVIAAGRYDEPLAGGGEIREVSDLGEGFRDMAAAVRDRERRLEESRQRYQRLFNGTNDAVLVYQLAADGSPTPFVEVNAVACRMLGYSRAELLATHPQEILSPAALAGMSERLRRLQEDGHYLRELELRRRDGSVVPTEVHAHRFDLLGTPTVLSVARDVSERRQAAQALAESERKFRSLVESANAIPWEVDWGSATFTYVGAQVERVLGYPAGSWVSVAVWADRLHPEDRDRVLASRRDAVARGADHDLQYRVRTAAGGVCWIHDVASVVAVAGGPARLTGFMFDVSELKQAEAERRELEGRLSHSQRMEAVGTLAGGIAHDFNNLLHAISGYASLLLSDLPDGGEQRRRVAQIEKAADRGAELVRRLLTFSRKAAPERRRLVLNDEVAHALQLLAPAMPKMIRVETQLAADLLAMEGDPTQIEQVIMNLGVNARDAMADTGCLHIETRNLQAGEAQQLGHREAGPGRHVLLRVADTGCGMAPEVVPHVFEPFFTTKEVGQGTGLGLSTVYGIVRSHNGWIHCHSEVGVGTAFEILFPAIEEPPERRVAPEPAPPAGAGGGETILLVDDEAAVRDVGQEALQGRGYRVRTAESAEQALAVLRSSQDPPVDLVILDLGMPGMGGRRGLEAILAESPETRVLVASGYAPDTHAEAALRAGARGFIGKPYRFAELARRVREVLDG